MMSDIRNNRNQIFLVAVNVFLVFFLIVLSNLQIVPMRIGDFVFFAILTLALALYRPGWVFLFFVGTIMLENINLAPVSLGVAISPYQFFGGMTIIALIIRLLTKRLNFKLTKLIWQDYLVLAMGMASFLSVMNSQNKGTGLKQSVVLVSFMALYFLARNFLQTIADMKKIVPFFLSSSVVVVGYGIWQNIRFAHNLSNFEVMPGRPNATFAEADWLGIFLSFLLAMLYSWIFYINKKEEASFEDAQNPKSKFQSSNQIQNSKFKKLLTATHWLLIVLVFTLLILTVSRSAWLGALAVTFIFLFSVFTRLKVQPKNWQWMETIKLKMCVIIALAISIALVYFFQLTTFQLGNRAQSTGTGLQKITVACPGSMDVLIPQTVASEDEYLRYGCRQINLEEIEGEKIKGSYVNEIYRKDPNVSIRSEIYKKSWELIKAHPILGIGWGSISAYLGKDARGAGLNASNIFLEIWLGAGIFGLIAFVALLIIIMTRALHNFAQDDAEMKSVGLFILLGLVAIVVPNLFNSGIMLGFLWLFLGASFIVKAKK